MECKIDIIYCEMAMQRIEIEIIMQKSPRTILFQTEIPEHLHEFIDISRASVI